MANYDLAVSWSGKDGLADSSAAKVISGGDFHTEFTAVKAAVNTKADINGSASEALSATTASAGTNTTQVATTAFVDASFAKKASPTFTGTAAAPTAATATDTTQIATTAFVQANTPAASSSVLGLVKASLSGTTLTIATS
jgi:hypothetical protein